MMSSGASAVECFDYRPERGISKLTNRPVLFEVPRAVPTIGLPLRLRRCVPHNGIERGQDGAGDYQDRGDNEHSFGHIPLTRTGFCTIRKSHASACQLPKCKPAILICRATGIWFGHYRKCVMGRPSICPGNCGNVLSVTRISSRRNICRIIAFATCGPASRANISLKI